MKIINQIQLTLDEINTLFNQIKSQADQAKLIEIDLLKYKIVQLYDSIGNISSIQKEEEKTPTESQIITEEKKLEIVPEKEVIDEEIIPEEIEVQKPATDIAEPKVLIEENQEIVSEPIIEQRTEKNQAEEPKITSEPEIAPKETIEEPKVEPEKVIEEVVEKQELKHEFNPELFENAQDQIKKKAVYEKFARTEPSVNERIASAKIKGSVGDNLQKGPITDIKSAISLNLKLSLIKDLYQGDQKEYKKMIDFLSRCSNYSEAKMYLVNEKENRKHWANKQELVDTLMDLLTRRFRID